jgi:hypothetical protein
VGRKEREGTRFIMKSIVKVNRKRRQEEKRNKDKANEGNLKQE